MRGDAGPGREVPASVPRSVAPALALAAALGGCSIVGDVTEIEPVRPWEREVLARDDMQLITDPMDESVDEHIYFSREAARGGGRVRGGGCGCN